ncbi:hypothetical protein SDJN02_25739, partial [Cucurbita argyrosperma subsp. argyrosperma]
MASTLFISHPSLTLLSILSDNGFVSMAVMLQLIAQSLLSQSNSITIFSPSDTAFAQSGQPSLSLSSSIPFLASLLISRMPQIARVGAPRFPRCWPIDRSR